MAESLLDLQVNGRPVPLTLGVGITVRNQAAARFRLNAEHGLVAALRNVLPGDGSASVGKDEADRAKADGIRGLFRELTERSSKLCHVSLSVLLDAKSTGELDAVTAAVRDRLTDGAGGMQLLLEPKAQVPSFLAMLPGSAPYHPRRKGCTSRNAADLLPVAGPWPGSKHPMTLLRTPAGDPVPFDLFDPSVTAHHGLVAADTGSGKSMSFGAMLLEARAAGHNLIIVDNGGSFARMTRLLGGVHIPVDLGTSISPFGAWRDLATGEGELDPGRLVAVVDYLDLCASESGARGLTKVQRDVLGRAVKGVYEKLAGDANCRPLIGTFRDALGRMTPQHDSDRVIAQDLCRRLDVYASGLYSALLNRPSKLRFDAPILTFDLKGLGDDASTKALALATIAQAVTSGRPGRPTSSRGSSVRSRTLLVIDEGWNLLDGDAAGRLIESWYRVLRKEGKAIWMISQAFSDFTNCPAGDAIVQNAAIKLFLRARGGHQGVVDHFGLNSRAAEAFRSLEMRPGHHSDLLCSYGDVLSVLRVAMDPIAYWLLTTHKADNEAFEEAQRRNPGWSEWAVLHELARRYPHGIEFTRRTP